ncbi:winged helix-turn-helix transcriptional regulator [Martelella mangrovi]|uniref:DNA-binding HxlR family transcriptional regulator n=1 Tax=Martelella mangrovi TaxID=1397477 RepID=A0ABV2I5D3_9HYPH
MDQRVEQCPQFNAGCMSREILDQISGKWSIMTLTVLSYGPHRFNAIRKRLEGVSQKALTDTLRRLERNGLVRRHVLATSPVGVEYELTALGASVKALYCGLYDWVVENGAEIAEARKDFDRKMG